MTTERIPILLCIDVEPDQRKLEFGSKSDWLGFERSFKFFQEFRSRWSAINNAAPNFSWFIRLDPQIAEVYESPTWPLQQLNRDLRRAADQ